ncbi:MAG: hypothetical protein PCFJNLEI_02969 [Verrucomicrobiae bacterium]|nr:hypothetical protein [Verrucomicrobiae bacterium]
MNKHVLYWLPAVVWALAIFLLSSMSYPANLPGASSRYGDKLGHWIEYSVLAWWCARAFANAHRFPLAQACLLALFVAALYGATDELHQHFVPDRTADVQDWLMDTLGAAAATAAYYAYESYRRAKTNR